MRRVRQVHVWLGVFFAPAILFFACSGALMTLDLHKSRNGSEVLPVVARMAEIHRKQSAFPSAPKAPTAEKSPSAKIKDESSEAGSRTLFRAFVVLMAVGLAATTVLGLVMAFTQSRQRSRLAWALALGLVLPVVLLLL